LCCDAGSGGASVTAPAEQRTRDRRGLAIRRDPLDPGRRIDYTTLSPPLGDEGVVPDQAQTAAYEAGFADGQRVAELAARDAEHRRTGELERAVRALDRSADAARSAYEQRSAEFENSLPRFAFELLELLFGRESQLAVDPGRDAIARALALDETTLPARARLAPCDATMVGDLAELTLLREVTVVADPTIEPGGAVVEVGATTIDAQLSQALQRVRAVMVDDTDAGAS
jgi:flagellar assembly protein FliH